MILIKGFRCFCIWCLFVWWFLTPLSTIFHLYLIGNIKYTVIRTQALTVTELIMKKALGKVHSVCLFVLWCLTPFQKYFSYIVQSVLLEKETKVQGKNHQPVASLWQTLSHNVVSSTPPHEWGSKSQL